MADTATLTFLGDLMLGRGVSRKLARRPPEWFWGDALPILRRSDAVIANLESPITESDWRWRGWKMFRFKARPEAVGILRTANVRFVCLANNHMLDYGERGLADTLDALDRAGIAHAGAGRDPAEAAAAATVDLPNLKVGLIAATDTMPEFAVTGDRPGTNYREFRADSPCLDWVAHSVADLRRAGASLVVLSVHWGPNMRTAPPRDRRHFAHAAIERGVDVIHGHSAHVVHAVERHGRGIVLYDTGNFIDDYWKFPFRRTITSFLFNLDVADRRPARLRLIPILIHGSPLALATGRVFTDIIDDMRSLSAERGTVMTPTPDGLELVLD